MAVHTNGYVALQHHTHLTGMGMSGLHLLVQHILHPPVIVGLVRLVALAAEIHIAVQPMGRLLQKKAVGLGAAHAGRHLLEYQMKILILAVVHRFVVHLRQAVELLTSGLHLFGLCLVLERRQLAQVAIHGMQGIDADGRIGIRVHPGVGTGSIIDGQNLQDVLTRPGHPVGHSLQVAKVTHAKTAFAAE